MHMIVTGNINNQYLGKYILGIECQSTHMIVTGIVNETLNYPIHIIFSRIDHVQLLDRYISGLV